MVDICINCVISKLSVFYSMKKECEIVPKNNCMTGREKKIRKIRLSLDGLMESQNVR